MSLFLKASHMNIFLSCVAALICFSFSVAGANDEAPPNVLIIMTDEHNLRTLGCYRDLMVKSQAEIWGEGVTVSTPNLDSLAKNGALFSNFMTVSPACTPSRGSFLTGTYPSTHAALRNHIPMRDDAITFAQTMKEKLGYATSYMGKVSVLSYSCRIAVYTDTTISSASLILNSSIICSFIKFLSGT